MHCIQSEIEVKRFERSTLKFALTFRNLKFE